MSLDLVPFFDFSTNFLRRLLWIFQVNISISPFECGNTTPTWKMTFNSIFLETLIYWPLVFLFWPASLVFLLNFHYYLDLQIKVRADFFWVLVGFSGQLSHILINLRVKNNGQLLVIKMFLHLLKLDMRNSQSNSVRFCF